MSDHHVGSENVKTSGELKRKLSTIEEEMKSCNKQISVVKRQKTELFGFYEQKLSNVKSNIQASNKFKRKLSTIEEEMELCNQQISVVNCQRTELFGLYEQKLKEYIEPDIADMKKNYTGVLDQINMMQDQLKEMDLK